MNWNHENFARLLKAERALLPKVERPRRPPSPPKDVLDAGLWNWVPLDSDDEDRLRAALEAK